MKAYKMTWHFVKKQLKLIIIMVLSLILFQFLSALSPLVIQNILDNQVLAIVDNWYETDKTSNAVEYQGNYYDKTSVNNQAITIMLLDDGFYVSENKIDLTKNVTDLSSESKIKVDNQIYPITKLTTNQVKSFYNQQLPTIIKVIIILIIVQLLSVLFSYIQRLSGAYMFSNVARDVRLEAAEKLSYLNLQELEAEPAGKTANRFLNDSSGVPQLYMSTINIVISSGLAIVFSFIGMYMLEPKLAIICLIIIPIMYFWITIFSHKIIHIAKKVNETNSLIVGRINEIINGIEILKAFNTESEIINDFNQLNNQFVDEQMQEVNLHVKGGWNAIQLFQGIVSALIVIVLAYLSVEKIIPIEAGVIYAYYVYIGRIIAPIGLLFHELGMIEHSKVKIERIFKILNAKLEDKTQKPIPEYRGKVEFNDIKFTYPNSKTTALSNINLTINPGSKVGIVGRSGSGKSTIINLLLRFNELEATDRGMIYIDDLPINFYSKRTYRQHIGIILQEPIIFGGTIASNIRFGQEVTDQEIITILEQIGAEKLLVKINYNIDFPIVNRGENLSLGEKQIICFARVLVRNPKILIMDEATANIDLATEKMINQAIKVASEKRTMIIIAHRLSTIRDADNIVLLEQGKIIETGNHQQLMKNKGKYARMYSNQNQM